MRSLPGCCRDGISTMLAYEVAVFEIQSLRGVRPQVTTRPGAAHVENQILHLLEGAFGLEHRDGQVVRHLVSETVLVNGGKEYFIDPAFGECVFSGDQLAGRDAISEIPLPTHQIAIGIGDAAAEEDRGSGADGEVAAGSENDRHRRVVPVSRTPAIGKSKAVERIARGVVEDRFVRQNRCGGPKLDSRIRADVGAGAYPSKTSLIW